MPTTVVKTIKPLGGGDYSTVAAWVTARKGNLVTRDTVEVAELYAGGNLGELLLESADWTVDATHYIVIRPGPDQGHPGIYDNSKVQFVGVTDNPFWVKVGFTRVEPGICITSEIDGPIVGSPHCVLISDISADAPCVIDGVIARITGGIAFRAEYCNIATEHVFKNCLSIEKASTTTGFRATNASIAVRHCTAINSDIGFHADNDGGAFGPPAAPGKITTENCYFSGAVCYLVEGTGSSIVKGSKDATSNSEATDPNLRGISIGTAGFINVADTYEDLHLISTSILRAKGADTAVFVDMDQHARPFTLPDIGALQYTVPTTVVKTIGSGGDYPDWASWLAARKGNLAVRDTVEVAEIMGGGGGIVGARLEDVSWGTNGKNYVHIRAATGHGHVGLFDTAKAYFKNAAGTRDAFFCSVGATRIGPGLLFENSFYTGGQDPRALHFQDVIRSGPLLVDGIILKNSVIFDDNKMIFSQNCQYDNSLPHRVRNSMCWTAGGNTACKGFTLHARWKAHNNTVFALGASSGGIVASGGTTDCQNNYVDSAVCFETTGGGTINKGTKDATSNAEALTPSLRNIAPSTANFVDPRPVGYPSTNIDAHIFPASPLYQTGADLLSEGVTRDFESDYRDAPFDIGADENSEAAPPPGPPGYTYQNGDYEKWTIPNPNP